MRVTSRTPLTGQVSGEASGAVSGEGTLRPGVTRKPALDVATPTAVASFAAQPRARRPAAEVYLGVAVPIAMRQVVANIGRGTDQRSPLTGEVCQTAKGGVIAAASSNPDYRFVWDRDGALVMRALVGLAPEALADYVQFSRARQQRAAQTSFDPKNLKVAPGFEWAERWIRKDASHGLGEPRELPNGSFDPFQWGRPQTDGPALRALTMVDLLAEPLSAAQRAQVIEVLRADLDYVAEVWPEVAFDLWEETLAGKHYYTREVQAAALHAASRIPELADRRDLYAKAAAGIDAERGQFWNGTYLRASLDVKAHDGHTAKTTDLDSNVILAAVHSGRIDSRVLATAHVVEQRDLALFPLNADASKRLGAGIGRYDGDVYFGGNPFYMLTLAFAELCYRVAADITRNGLDVDTTNVEFLRSAPHHGLLKPGASFAPGSGEASRIAAALLAKGDSFVNRVAKHARVTPDGKGGHALPLPEQFDKVDGTPRSADDLTWSNAALVSAARVRELATKATPRFPFNHAVSEVMRSPDAALAFVEDYLDHEAPFFAAARDAKTGLAFDGVDLNPKTLELSGFRRLTATSKECTDVAVIAKMLTGHPLAARLAGKGDARTEALAILGRKIDSYERWDREYPGYAGFMPWIKISADGTLGPADKHWENNVPSLDNGEWLFTLLALEHVLRQQGETVLADRYKSWNDKLARNVKRVFWDEKVQAVRVQARISDNRDPNATYTSHDDPSAFMRGPHGVHEGAMILHFMSLYANPGLTPAQVKKVWSDTKMVAVEHAHGTTWQGYWGSPHEEWEFAIMPKRDQPEWQQLFRIRQKIRTQDAVERGKPGFGASINAPDSGPQESSVAPYAGDHGVPSIALQPTTDYPFYAIYGAFSLLLEQADSPDHREGIAWLLNTLRARDAVTPMGAGESVNNDGSKSAPLKTIDGSLLNWLGLMGGLCDEVRACMQADGTYEQYQAILREEYRESFPKPLAEPSGFAAPQIAVPWAPPVKPVTALALRSSMHAPKQKLRAGRVYGSSLRTVT